jgi:hypothetical protein
MSKLNWIDEDEQDDLFSDKNKKEFQQWLYHPNQNPSSLKQCIKKEENKKEDKEIKTWSKPSTLHPKKK